MENKNNQLQQKKMLVRLSTLPTDLVRLTMEFCLHRHRLPYPWVRAFNACLHQLPKRSRVTRFGKTFVRYEHFPDDSYPYRKPRKRMVRADYAVAFGNHRIQMEEVVFDVLGNV